MSQLIPLVETEACRQDITKKRHSGGRVTNRNDAQILEQSPPRLLPLAPWRRGRRPFGGFDMDCLASGGVATHTCSAPAHLKDAEADDADTLALLQVLGNPVDHVVENGLGLLL